MHKNHPKTAANSGDTASRYPGHAAAYRILRLKRHVNLLVSPGQESGPGHIVQGTYQTPILVQHDRPTSGVRQLDITVWSIV